MNPITVPTIDTVSPIIAFGSFLLFPTTARTMPIGPKTTGRNKKEIAPRAIAAFENPFEVLVEGDIEAPVPNGRGEASGSAWRIVDEPHFVQYCPEVLLVPQ